MKQIKIVLLCSVLSFFSVSLSAQSSRQVPGVSANGYWVIESNVSTPLNNTIHFYNNDNVLVYRETLQGVRLNINRKKIRVMLQQVLETSLLAWQQSRQALTDKDYVKVKLR